MALMHLDIPEDVNSLLRKFAIDEEKGSREKATVYILANFLKEYYRKEIRG